ncbi:hypothetical protein [Demequina maris]|uniref:hypothetical protein n=1 Tax=Demequina maris TaxID=1638982 RepID=UPI000783623B|nr:hypothetical protein [Demequina maris]
MTNDRDADYGALSPDEQTAMREAWRERVAARIAQLDYAARFEEAGESYSSADADGNVVIHNAGAARQ